MLPKKVLDQDTLDIIIKYYKIKKSEDFDMSQLLEWECFSHPSLELHECNSRTLLPGRHRCTVCEHVVGRPCNLSCDFQTACLAAYAWRLGIGGSNFRKAFKHNLSKLTPKELYNAVIKKFTGEEVIELANEEVEETVPVVVPEVEGASEYVTISEAAEILACSVATIYNYTSAGKIPYKKEKRKFLIKKEDLSGIVIKSPAKRLRGARK
ncbi:helix-turn-helix domain-containing protein [bacterium]|nr:helix-turn-helix domain-containing protein [bacterium]